MRVLFRLAVVVLFAIPPAAQELEAGLIRALEELIEEEMEAQDLVGLSVAVGVDGELVWTRGFGLADLENEVPATEHTVYRLGSISKPVTAAAVMQLAEREELDLDAPVDAYVPEWPEKRWPVTTRQLLGHLGGVRHYLSTDEPSNTKAYGTATESLEIFASDPLVAEPGTRYAYSTFGYNLLGAVVESVSELTFIEYLERNVFPAAGTEALQDDSQSRIIPHRAQGYRLIDGEVRNSILTDISYKLGGGGLCGTAADLVRFAHAMQAGRIVSPETRDLMWTRQRTADGAETDSGLGWGLLERGGRRIVRHGGAQARVRTSLVYFVDDGVVVAAMCNCEWSNPPRITVPVARRVVDSRG